MWESLVASLLTKFFGKYLSGLESENRKVSLVSGKVELENVALKKTALEELMLPIKVKSGKVGKLTLKIPWRNLTTQPVLIKLESLFVVVSPAGKHAHDPKSYQEKLLATKRSRLQLAEMFAGTNEETNSPSDPNVAESSGKTAPKSGGGFADKLLTAMLNNVQISIEDVHFRYEDDVADPKHPFVCGATIQSLYVQTTNKDWSPSFFSDAISEIYKLVALNNLSLYWNSDCFSALQSGNLDSAFLSSLIYRSTFIQSNAIASDDPISSLRYILQPVSGRLQISRLPGSTHLEFIVESVG